MSHVTARPDALRVVTLPLLALALLAGGCQKGSPNPQGGNGAQASSPGPAGPFMGMKDAEGPLDNHAIPLRATGLNSAEEMNRDLGKLADPALKSAYEMAFRYDFSAKMAQRNFPEAARLANEVITKDPNFAPAYRVLGYAMFNTNRGSEALTAYNRAVSVDPNYGEAHYALAFLLAMGDQASGREHFRRAMELGVKDERKLGEQFYPPTQ